MKLLNNKRYHLAGEPPSDPDRRKVLVKTAACAGIGAGLTSGTQAVAQTSGGVRWGIEGHEAPEIKLDYWIDAEGEPGHFSAVSYTHLTLPTKRIV